jgi:hypothetical protein
VVAGAVQQVAGVVIEEVQDLGVGSVGQGPVGEVGLPGLVGLVRFEAPQRGAGALVGFRGDGSGLAQDSMNGARGRRPAPFQFKMAGDGFRACVKALGGEALPQGKYAVPDGRAGRLWAAAWAPGPGREARFAGVGVAAKEFVHPLPADAVAAGGFGFGHSALKDGQDDDLVLRHGPAHQGMCRLCPATCRQCRRCPATGTVKDVPPHV